MGTRELRAHLETLQAQLRVEREVPTRAIDDETAALEDELVKLIARRSELKARVQQLEDELVVVKRETRESRSQLSKARSEVADREQLAPPAEEEQASKPEPAWKIVFFLGAVFIFVLVERCG